VILAPSNPNETTEVANPFSFGPKPAAAAPPTPQGVPPGTRIAVGDKPPPGGWDATIYGSLTVTIVRATFVTPKNEKRDVLVRVGWADDKTKKFINFDQTKVSPTKSSNAPQWDFVFKDFLKHPRVVRIEVHDTKMHLGGSGTYLGYSILDWALLRKWYKAGQHTDEIKVSVYEGVDTAGKNFPGKLPTLFVRLAFSGKSLDDDVLGVSANDVTVLADNVSKGWSSTFSSWGS